MSDSELEDSDNDDDDHQEDEGNDTDKPQRWWYNIDLLEGDGITPELL